MKSILLFVALIASNVWGSAHALSNLVEEKSQRIIEFVGGKQFVSIITKNHELCESFLMDFTSQSNIKYERPIVVARRYGDDALQSFLNACPNLEMRTPVVGRSGPYVGPRRFKLYRVNLRPSADDGHQFLFLESAFWTVRGRATNYEPMIQGKTIFRLFDGNRCQRMGSIHVGGSVTFAPETDLSNKSPDTSFHDVIMYQGNYYVFDLIFQRGYGSPLSLFTYDEERPSNFSAICKYMEKRPVDFPEQDSGFNE